MPEPVGYSGAPYIDGVKPVFTQAMADDLYVNVTGDVMTGFLTLNADPTSALHAVTKQYADALMIDHLAEGDPHPQYLLVAEGNAAYVLKAGDTMTGALTIAVATGGQLLTLASSGVGDPILHFLKTGVQAWVIGIDDSDADKFKIASSGALETVTALTITTSNLVGINTATPSGRLEVRGDEGILVGQVGSSRALEILTSGTVYRIRSAGGAAADDLQIMQGNTGILTLHTTAVERVRILAGGDVGIGIADPTMSPNQTRNVAMYGAPTVGLKLIGSRTIEADIATLSFINNPTGTTFNELVRLEGVREQADNSGLLNFYVMTAGALTARMQLTTAGKLRLFSPAAITVAAASLPLLLQGGGGGTTDILQIETASGFRIATFDSDGDLLFRVDELASIGAAGANRPTAVYVVSQVAVGVNADMPASGLLRLAGSSTLFSAKHTGTGGAMFQLVGTAALFNDNAVQISLAGALGNYLAASATGGLPVTLSPVGVTIGSAITSPPTNKGMLRLLSRETSLEALTGIEFSQAPNYGYKVAVLDNTVSMIFANREDSATWTELMRLKGRGTIETTGAVGNTAAIFGAGGNGVALVRSSPSVGLNAYYNAGWKAIFTGAAAILGGDGGGGFVIYTAPSAATDAALTLTERLVLSAGGSVVIGALADLASTATEGFVYIPSDDAAPTGTPNAFTGKVAMMFDRANNKLMVYDGGWVGITLA
jgi:hypothetical protein